MARGSVSVVHRRDLARRITAEENDDNLDSLRNGILFSSEAIATTKGHTLIADASATNTNLLPGAYGGPGIHNERKLASALGLGAGAGYVTTYQPGTVDAHGDTVQIAFISGIAYIRFGTRALGWGNWSLQAEPPGISKVFRGATLPAGYLWEDAARYPQTLYPALYAAIGDTYQTPGTPSDQFCVPDTRGVFPLGAGQGPSPLTNRVRGARGGLESVILTIPQMPAHTHLGSAATGNARADGNTPGGGLLTGQTNESVTSSTGGNGAHENMPPFLVSPTIIKF